MTIGNRIIQARKEKGLTQEYLAAQLQVSRQAVSKWETGQSAPDTKNLIALSQLLGVSVEYLATGKQEPPAPKPDYRLSKALNAAAWVLFAVAALAYGYGLFSGEFTDMVTIWVGNIGIGVPPLFYGDSPAAVAVLVVSIIFTIISVILWYISHKIGTK